MHQDIFRVSEESIDKDSSDFNSNKYFKKRLKSLEAPSSICGKLNVLKNRIVSGILEYCKLTTLHGLRYVTEPDRPLYERIFWLLALALVYVGMFITISAQVKKYLSNPILMSLNGEITPAWDIPFPAVTICSENQFNPSLINLTEIVDRDNRTNDEKMKLNLGIRYCTGHVKKLIAGKFNLADEFILDAESNLKFALKFSPHICRRIVKSLRWQNKIMTDPCSYLQTYPTNVGFCFVFNMLPFQQLYTDEYVKEVTPKIFDELSNIPYKYSLLSDRVWDMSGGYKELSFSENFLPWRTPGVSFDNSATFVLDFNKDDLEENCIPKGHGFWVVVHNPAEVPSPYQTVAYAETDMTTIYKLIPKQTTTADNLREWTPEERGCFYRHERKLKLYNTYSSHNCLYECEAEMIFKRCKCAATFISHYKISTPICGVHQIDCMQNVLENFSSQHHESNHFSSCNCLPACTEINYDIEYSDIPLDFEDPTSKRNNTEKGTTAVVTFHFKMNSVDNIQRVAIVTLSDFVANIGGLLGLFLGFSFLSFFEIIYFMTIRWVTNVWNKRNRQHSRERKAESLFEELKG